MLTSQQIIMEKQKILAEAPYSGANLKGKDTLFFIKEPGVDALVYDNGSVAIREGWGQSRNIRRYGSIKKAIEDLKNKGFAPYNIFQGPAFNDYERKNEQYKKQKESQQAFFQDYEINKRSANPRNVDINVPQNVENYSYNMQPTQRRNDFISFPDPTTELLRMQKGLSTSIKSLTKTPRSSSTNKSKNKKNKKQSGGNGYEF